MLYGADGCARIVDFRHSMFTRKKDGQTKHATNNKNMLALYIMRAHLQAMLWKAADQQNPPNVDINDFGWDVTAKLPPAPPAIMKVIACCCQAKKNRVKYSTDRI